jgi:hypothetical protein
MIIKRKKKKFLATIATELNEIRRGKQSIYTEEKKAAGKKKGQTDSYQHKKKKESSFFSYE